MALHWTYCTFDPSSDLQQGDILSRTDELLAVLKNVHSYFCDERYLAFIVVTQSCDLVRRKAGSCKARHISLAVVREFDRVLPSLIGEVCAYKNTSILRSELKLEAREFVSRILDQNEQAKGLFYLHPSADAGIATASVAFLRITITLRQEHYDLLQRCRVGRLESEFTNKLGWLVGNLYSRVGTPDWADYEGDKRKDTLVKEYVDDAIPEESWVPDSWINSAVAKGVDLSLLQGSPANELRQYAPLPPLNVMIDEVCQTALAVKIDGYGQMFADSISSDRELRAIFIQDVVSHFQELLTPEEQESFVSTLLGADSFTSALTVSIRSILAKAKNYDDGDAVIKAIEAGGQSSKCLPLLRKSIESVLIANLGKQPNTVSSLFDRTPFLTNKSMEVCRRLVESAGHSNWLIELVSLRKRLASSSKLKSITGS
jgi:hypothetical protein